MPTVRPATLLDAEQVRAALVRRERQRLWLAIGQLALGVGLTFILPMAFSGLWFANMWTSGIGTYQLALLFCAILMLIAYFIEWRTRGEWLVNQLRSIGPLDMTWGTTRYWGFEAIGWALFMEIYLWVPRMTFEGIDRLRAIAAIARIDRPRAVEMIRKLGAQGHGVPAAALQNRGDDNAAFSRLLAYLSFYDWIGASEKGDRAWLSTDAKESLGLTASRTAAAPPTAR
ncbi:MAG TPA: hypothetical protein VH253_11815 [Phycisphaerae bacterium]|nr:hypothetical protein [Phycisphaerae bacterium]